MFVEKISLENFRNLQSQTLSLHPRINIFTGANGSGKTNILESIATLCLGRSQRINSSDNALIQSGKGHFRLTGVIQRQERSFELSVACENTLSTRGKKIVIDGQPARASELFRTFSLVALSPEDSDIISGSPSARRRFLDFHLSQASVSYLDNLTRYQRILAQRNSHLRQYPPDTQGTPFDDEFVTIGAKITHFRMEFLNYAQDCASDYYRRISSGESLECHYLPSIVFSASDRKLPAAERSGALSSNSELSQLESRFRARLEARREAETYRQATLVGPHRDDIEFAICNLPARSHGSQGQWRSAAVSLKLAVYDFLRERKEDPPILLLDEIFAELDIRRQRALIGSFSDLGQLIVTTALAAPDSIADNARIFLVADGVADIIQ